MKIRILLLLLPLTLGACVTVKPVVLDRKTQLENQVLGTFQQLKQDLVLASSVRGPGAGAAEKLSPLEREAAEAVMQREFHRDDLEQLKADKAVGEGKDAMVVLLSAPEEAAAAARARRLVKEENAARAVIMDRVIQLNADLKQADLPLVRRIFRRLNRTAARPGDLVQRDNGKWEEVR